MGGVDLTGVYRHCSFNIILPPSKDEDIIVNDIRK